MTSPNHADRNDATSAPARLPARDVRRVIGFWSGTALLVGTMIGGGIFRTPASIASVMQDPILILLLWLFFGVVALCGALTVAELATMLPQTGGTYVYLRAAYGDSAAFVFGWLYLLVAIPSGVAAAAVFFAELLLTFIGAPSEVMSWGIAAVAITVIIVLSAINVASVTFGTGLNNIFTVVKVTSLLAIIVGGLFFASGDVTRWYVAPAGAGVQDWTGAIKAVLFTYSGWIYVSLVAGELKEAERRFKFIILAGTGTVVLLYLLANLTYLYLMPLTEMPGRMVGTHAMFLVAGPIGAALVTASVLGSVFGGLNGVILTKARVAYAQARDGLSFAFLGRVHPTRATPHISIIIQGAGAVVLVIALREAMHPLRLFDRLIAYFVLVEWLALVFAVGAVFVLRRTRPDLPRPYRTPGYPFVPLFFVGATVLGLGALVWNSCARGDFSPLVGLAIVLAGFPVYWLWRRAGGGHRGQPGAGAVDRQAGICHRPH